MEAPASKKKVYRCFQRKALLTAGKKRKTRHKLHKADTKPLSIPDGTTDLCKVLQVQAKGWALNMLMQQRGKYMVGRGKRVVSLRCIKSMGMGGKGMRAGETTRGQKGLKAYCHTDLLTHADINSSYCGKVQCTQQK